jgi:hypothetical protein
MSRRQALSQWGYALMAVDLLNWIVWIAYSGYAIGHQDVDRATASFTALVSPHTIIIPTILAIINDLWKHCRTGEKCSVDTPHWQWYLFPILVLPIDVLTLVFNVRELEGDTWLLALSVWSLINTVLVVLWSWYGGWLIYDSRERARLDGEKDQPLLSEFGRRHSISM